MLRTTLVFQRPTAPRRVKTKIRLIALTVSTIACIVAALLTLLAHSSVTTEAASLSPLDSDADGLPDRLEVDGWRSQTGGLHHTDPDKADTDGDGLEDGEEAGPRIGGNAVLFVGRSDPSLADTDSDGLLDSIELGDPRSTGVVVRFAVSNPQSGDSDGDDIGDGDEYFLDINPLSSDTDADGLLDEEELSFGSDPTLVNLDGDAFDDPAELERGSDPMSYDMTVDEKIAAAAAGATFGECHECALDDGLRVEQLESFEYLAGHIASGVALYGDVRDVLVSLWDRDFTTAGLSGLGLLPFVGDSSKTAAMLIEFAARSDRALLAVRAVTERLQLPETVKKQVLAHLPSQVGRLPIELSGGPSTYSVYKGADYVGITNNVQRRFAEHASAGRSFEPQVIVGATGLSRGQARAVEQACINMGGLQPVGGYLQNRINSIGPSQSYHADAVAYGVALLESTGGTCPIP